MSSYLSYYHTQDLGCLEIISSEKAIVAVNFCDTPEFGTPENKNDLIQECIDQLNEYFHGKRYKFLLPLQMEGSEFQQKVWLSLLDIPYGHTSSYQDIAKSIDNPHSCRAVGNANHQNKISIIVPCHRVVGKNGSMTGYGGGIWRKEWLIRHEKSHFQALPLI